MSERDKLIALIEELANVKADAWDEGWDACENRDPAVHPRDNPYRTEPDPPWGDHPSL